MKKILFLGDSFTWGEGLELYMDKEPFISMRNQKATDIELEQISNYKDDEVENWRKRFRFTGYVDGFETYVQPNNGGNFHRVVEDANLLTKKYNFSKKDIIVIQIPPADRSYFQMNSDSAGSYLPLYKELSNQSIQNLLIKKDVSESLSKIMGYDSVMDMLKNSEDVFDKLAYRNTKLFYYSFVFDLIQRFNVYFIGPWGKENYKAFSKCDEFKDKLIPITYNGSKYDSLQSFGDAMVENNQIFEISEQFKQTSNNHPTLEAHKIIGESINKFLKDELRRT